MTERSVLAAVSGIQANQTYLDSIGNNIANANTVGYKDSEVQFQDLLSEQLSGASAPTSTAAGINPVAIGSGTRIAANEVDLQEGTPDQTGNPSDVAIQGDGYLIATNAGQQLFTRDGSMTVDANGNLSTQTGGQIQGWQATSAGVIDTSAPLTAVKIPTGETIGATTTSTLTLGGNLPSWDGTGTAPVESTTLDAYDPLGVVVPVTLTFTGVAGTANEWTMQGTTSTPAGVSSNLWTTAPTVKFSPTTGQMIDVNTTAASSTAPTSIPVSTNPAGYNFAATPLISVAFPESGSAGAVTQFSGASTIEIAKQDGYASGTMESYAIGSDGTITGSFSNGASLALGQIALANFANPGGLTNNGGTMLSTSPNSGQAEIGTPGTAGRGTLLGGELEQSNVDLGTELTELISAQEAYTANTKVLTTSSQVIQALENVQ